VLHLRLRAKLALRTPGTDRVIHGSLRRAREFALRWKLVADASRAGGWRLAAGGRVTAPAPRRARLTA